MKSDAQKFPLSDGRRPRLPVLAAGLALLWTAYGYCRGGSQGLLVLVVFAVAVAVGLRRSLPGTVRSAVWSTLLAVLLCMAANIARIGDSTENQLGGMDAAPYDRAAMVAFAASLATLFFRPSRSTVTILCVGLLPALVVALERANEAGAGENVSMLLPGVALALVVLAAQCQRATAPRAPGVPSPGRREWGLRLVLPALWLLLTIPLTPPVASLAEWVREKLYTLAGLNPPEVDPATRRANLLSVASPSADFAGRVRMLLEIDAAPCPGYLRESVYRSYARRQWSGRSSIIRPPEQLPSWPDRLPEEGWISYALGAAEVTTNAAAWTFRPLGKGRLASFCLPGTARTVAMPVDVDPLVSSDGIVTLEQTAHPPLYKVQVEPSASDPAFPRPDYGGLPEYLEIPAQLAPSVSNWVHSCPALENAVRTADAVSSVESHFRAHFTYRLGTTSDGGEPLADFMERREGHCTLFASAAALMLRMRGIPTRVVGGYLCSERHAYTARWVVRERDGHAWCEAWDAETGRWQLVEATPPGGLPDALPPPSRARLLWERLTHGWRRFMDRLRASNPVIVLADLLAGVLLWTWGLLRSPVGGILALGIVVLLGWRVWRRRNARLRMDATARLKAEIVRVMATLERKWVPSHARRLAHEPWEHLWVHVGADLPPERAAQFRALLEEYQELRYRTPFDTTRARAWLAKVRDY